MNPSFWDKLARKYAARPLADPAAYERTLERTNSYLKKTDAVVEFGCGTGTTALRLAPSVTRMVASDISQEMIAIAKEKAQAGGAGIVEFAVETIESAPWADGSFDAAIAFNLLNLVKARKQALARVHRLLKSGGYFISKSACLGDANPIYRVIVPVMQAFGQAPYVAFFSASEIEREIADAGFEIVANERHGSKAKDPRPFIVARRI